MYKYRTIRTDLHYILLDVYNICININRIQNQLRLLVATEDNILYVYNLDTNEGGDLTLLRQHRLDGKFEDSSKGTTQTDGASQSGDAAAANSDTGRFKQ